MANEVYKRRYSLNIGRNKKLIKRTIPASIIKPGGFEPTLSPAGAGANLEDGSYTDFLVVPGISIELTDLQIVASVSDTKETKTPNAQQTTIEIFNLSEATQNQIRSEDTVVLRAGYEQDSDPLPMVFAGQIVEVSAIKKGQDTITKLLCKAASVPRNNIRISKIYPKDTTLDEIINDLALIAANNGIPRGIISTTGAGSVVPRQIPFPNGYSVAGNLMDILTDLCSRNNLRCYTSLGRLYVEPKFVSPTRETVFLAPENIKGTIRPEDDAAGKTSSSPDKISGLSITTFLNGRISTTKRVRVTFGQYEGIYEVSSVKHELDFRGSKWDTIISCKRIK